MWVQERNGKYRFMERYKDPMTGKTKYVSVTMDKNTNSSKKIAQDILNKKINNCLHVNTQSVLTLSKLAEHYYEYQLKTVKLATAKRNYFAINTLTKMLGTDTLVNNLNAPYIISCFISSNKANSTLNEHLTRLKAFLRWAYRNDYINDISYLDKIERFKDQTHKEKIKDKYLEPNEITKLLTSMEQGRSWYYVYLTRFLILSGLRVGEALALDLIDVNLTNRTINVNKTYDAVNQIITTTKTACSTREVYIQDELYELIKKYLLYRREIEYNTNLKSNLFFINTRCKRIEYYSFAKYLRENAESSIGRKITCHALRHTHASLLLAEDVSIDTISRRLGHENSQITKDIYLHVTEKLKKADNATIKNLKLI